MRGFAHLGRVQYAFWFAGALLCSLCAGAYLERRFYQAAETRRLEEALRANGTRSVPVPLRGKIRGGRRAVWWAGWKSRGCSSRRLCWRAAIAGR